MALDVTAVGTVSGSVPPEDDDAGRVALDPAYVLPTRVAYWAQEDPDRPFLVEVTGRRASYGQTWQGARRWSAWLTALGVQRGSRVVSMLPASVDAVLLWLGAGCVGALEVPVDPALRGELLRHVLADSGAALCLVRPEHAALVRSAGVPGLAVVVVERDGCPADDLSADGPVRLPHPADPSCAIYTSGTSGMPKGVVISWAQMSATIGRIPRSWLSGADAGYDCHPMFHVTGRSPLVVLADAGGRVVLRERFSATAFWDDVRTFGCTTTTAYVPLLLALPERADDADNPLRVVFGGHDKRASAAFAARFAVDTIDAYGSTEAGFPLVLRSAPPDTTRSWCGTPRRGYDLRVVDEHGADVPDGTVGELWVRPPARPLVLLEYLGQPEATAAATAGGWYRTGDAVVRHPEGFVFVDRLKDTIRRHGENISSEALESVVLLDDGVAECAVLGVRDEQAGQAVVLVVVPTDPGLDPAELWLRLRDELPRYMRPSYVVVQESLPRTPTNKVRKAELRQHLQLARAWVAPSR